MHERRIRDSFTDSGIEYVLVYRIVVYGRMQGFQGFEHPFRAEGTRTGCVWRFLPTGMGLSTTLTSPAVLRPIPAGRNAQIHDVRVP